MDENMNQIPEQEPETTDAFLDDWEGGVELTADQPEVDAEPMGGGVESPVEDPSESAETPDEGTEPPADACARPPARRTPPRARETRAGRARTSSSTR